MRFALTVLVAALAAAAVGAQPVSAQTTSMSPPVIPPDKVLTIDEAVAISLESQPQIHARLSDYAAARYRVDQALAPLLPQIRGSWNVARAQNVSVSRGVLGLGSERTVTSWNTSTVAQISLSQLLFDFGKTLASTEAARKLLEVAAEDVELQRQLLSLSVKEAYTNILFAQRLTRVNEQALERAQLNLRSAKGFFDVGTRPKSDVARAEVDVANARVDVIRARNAERLARVALNTAMGIDVDTQTQVQDNLAFEPMMVARTELRAEALRFRPEYRQSQLQVEQAEANARRAFRDFFPSITAGGFYGATRNDFNEIWELNLNLQWEIYDGGNRIARLKETKATIEANRARVRALALGIIQEVEQAYLNVQEAQERIQAAQTAVASAQENFRLAQGRFDAGVGTILELTDAQLFLTQAQNTETQALADYRISLYRLDRARGRR